MQAIPSTQFVLRVFNGPLQGGEFPLALGRTFFVVGAEATFCSVEQLLTVPEDAIYIPLESGGCNFEVLLDEHSLTACVVRELSADEVVEHSLPFQTVQRLGSLLIAVRPQDEEWHDALLQPLSDEPGEPVPSRFPGTLRQRVGVAVGLGVVLLAGLVGVGWYALQPSPVANIEKLIAGGNTNMSVVHGRDKALYVFADSERDASWGRQVMVRNGYLATQVLTTYDELTRLENLLAQLVPQLAYHQLDLSDPTQPRLLISQQRNILTPQLQQHLEQSLSVAAPYAREVHVITRDDHELARLAEEGLQRLALPFTRKQHPDSVTFSVEGSLADVELEVFSRYVADFNHVWGKRYVHFAIELKDDWLKGKSFQYGPQGYVKMNPSSWYFPKPL